MSLLNVPSLIHWFKNLDVHLKLVPDPAVMTAVVSSMALIAILQYGMPTDHAYVTILFFYSHLKIFQFARMFAYLWTSYGVFILDGAVSDSLIRQCKVGAFCLVISWSF